MIALILGLGTVSSFVTLTAIAYLPTPAERDQPTVAEKNQSDIMNQITSNHDYCRTSSCWYFDIK